MQFWWLYYIDYVSINYATYLKSDFSISNNKIRTLRAPNRRNLDKGILVAITTKIFLLLSSLHPNWFKYVESWRFRFRI